MSLRSTLRFIADHPVSRRRWSRNLHRLVGWQLFSVVWRRPIRFTMANDACLLAVRGLHSATGNLYVGLLELEEMAFVLHFLRPGDLFVDAGANVGAYTVLAATAGAHVLAFEPAAAARDWLQRNVALNRVGERVTVDPRALSDRAGQSAFISTWGARNRLAKDGDTQVETSTLDAALAGSEPRVLKIDVEDGAAAILRGAVRTLERQSLLCVLGELTHPDAVAELNRHGFTPCAYDPFERGLTALGANEVSRVSGAIFLRDVAAAEAVVRAAPPFVVHGVKI